MLTQAYSSKKGDLVIYMLDSLSIYYTNVNTYPTWEGLAVEINHNCEKSITVCNICRPPRDNNNRASIDLL